MSKPRRRRALLDRMRARAWAVHVHYHWESAVPAGTASEALAHMLETRRIAPARLSYLLAVTELIDRHLKEIDRRIEAALDNWSFGRLSRIDRAILRIGTAEMLYLDDVPPKVAIREAVRIADAYGGLQSPRFVNGVLDGIYRDVVRVGEREEP